MSSRLEGNLGAGAAMKLTDLALGARHRYTLLDENSQPNFVQQLVLNVQLLDKFVVGVDYGERQVRRWWEFSLIMNGHLLIGEVRTYDHTLALPFLLESIASSRVERGGPPFTAEGLSQVCEKLRKLFSLEDVL